MNSPQIDEYIPDGYDSRGYMPDYYDFFYMDDDDDIPDNLGTAHPNYDSMAD